MKHSLSNELKNSSVDRFLLFIVIVLLNLVSIRGFVRFDLTSQKTYSLSKASKDMVKHLEAPLSIKIFFSKNLPAPYSSVEQYLTDLLSEYKANGSGNFSYQAYDMSKEQNQRIAQEYGLSPVQVDTLETAGFTSKIAWMGVAITYGDYIAAIDALKTTADLEYKITTTISKIIAAQDSKAQTIFEIGYITGHHENELRANPYADSYLNTGAGNYSSLLSDIYSIRQINLSQEDIPENIKCIVINGPKDTIPEEQLRKIDSFILNGGNVAFYVDPLDEFTPQANELPVYLPNESHITDLLSGYGINIGNYYVLDNNCFTQNQSGYGKQLLNWVPVIEKNGTPKKNPITDNLGGILFFCNGPIDISKIEENPDLKTTVLAKTSSNSWITNENIILYPGAMLPGQNEQFKSQNIAVLLEGKFTSSFNPSVKGTKNARIVVISSSACTTDILIDKDGISPTSMFNRNVIDYLNNNDDFCTMRTKGQRLDFISIKNERSALIVKLLNQFGLAVAVILIGFIVWRMRLAKRYIIQKRYNPEDTRTIKKDSKKENHGDNK